MPSPLQVDYQILDEATDQPIPGRLLVLGDHAAFPDKRLFETTDRLGIVANLHAIRGTAKLVQVNHPRGSGFTAFQAASERANVQYDFDARTILGDFEGELPNAELRLPEESLWSDAFNALEVWNGFDVGDSNQDGGRETRSLDRVMRDWFSMLSLGMFVTPTGNSDTHKNIADPVGMPRTLMRVTDDSGAALASGTAVDAVIATQTGANHTPRDIVITNGPMITVEVDNEPALGRVVAPAGSITLRITMTSPDRAEFDTLVAPAGSITLRITMTSPDRAEFDTLEVLANTTPAPVSDSTRQPLTCFTSRTIANLDPNDPCATALRASTAMNVQLQYAPGLGTHRRFEASVPITLDPADIPNRTGAPGTDVWLAFRVSGNRAIFFPRLTTDAIDAGTQAALLEGDFDTIRAALTGKGVPAVAFTTPVFVDFDGGGYRAPFAP